MSASGLGGFRPSFFDGGQGVQILLVYKVQQSMFMLTYTHHALDIHVWLAFVKQG